MPIVTGKPPSNVMAPLNKIKLGNQEIARVYMGNKLVFENLPYVWILPTEKNGFFYSLDGINYSKLSTGNTYEPEIIFFKDREFYISTTHGYDIINVDNLKAGNFVRSYKAVGSSSYDCYTFAMNDDLMIYRDNYQNYHIHYSIDGGANWVSRGTSSVTDYIRYVNDGKFIVNRNSLSTSATDSQGNVYNQKQKIFYHTKSSMTGSTMWYSDFTMPDGTLAVNSVNNSWYCNGYYFSEVPTSSSSKSTVKMYRSNSFFKAQNELVYSGNSSYKFTALGFFCYCYGKYWALGVDTDPSGKSCAKLARIYYSTDGITWYFANIQNVPHISGANNFFKIMVVQKKLYAAACGSGSKHLVAGMIDANLNFTGTHFGSETLSENMYYYEVGFGATKSNLNG